MKDWLQVNPNGSKEAFEKYFKALSADAKKVCYQPIPISSSTDRLRTQIYKNQATEAVCISITLFSGRYSHISYLVHQKAARKAKNTGTRH
jgi:hypothetical protein